MYTQSINYTHEFMIMCSRINEAFEIEHINSLQESFNTVLAHNFNFNKLSEEVTQQNEKKSNRLVQLFKTLKDAISKLWNKFMKNIELFLSGDKKFLDKYGDKLISAKYGEDFKVTMIPYFKGDAALKNFKIPIPDLNLDDKEMLNALESKETFRKKYLSKWLNPKNDVDSLVENLKIELQGAEKEETIDGSVISARIRSIVDYCKNYDKMIKPLADEHSKIEKAIDNTIRDLNRMKLDSESQDSDDEKKEIKNENFYIEIEGKNKNELLKEDLEFFTRRILKYDIAENLLEGFYVPEEIVENISESYSDANSVLIPIANKLLINISSKQKLQKFNENIDYTINQIRSNCRLYDDFDEYKSTLKNIKALKETVTTKINSEKFSGFDVDLSEVEGYVSYNVLKESVYVLSEGEVTVDKKQITDKNNNPISSDKNKSDSSKEEDKSKVKMNPDNVRNDEDRSKKIQRARTYINERYKILSVAMSVMEMKYKDYMKLLKLIVKNSDV